jgi:hypothetical protein
MPTLRRCRPPLLPPPRRLLPLPAISPPPMAAVRHAAATLRRHITPPLPAFIIIFAADFRSLMPG